SLFSLSACVQQSEVRQMKHSVISWFSVLTLCFICRTSLCCTQALSLFSLSACVQQSEVRQMKHSVISWF
ncbi:hypothetical protein PSY81_24080, partial [Shigella flexneri]|nr:hypothetical protein [Shigella flexneri]